MRKSIATSETESTTPTWNTLEGLVRTKAQEFIQQILEEEVTELLGREKIPMWAWRCPVGAENRCGRPRGLPQRLRQAQAAGHEFGHD